MFKLGVWKMSQIHSPGASRRKISYRLLQNADSKDPLSVELFELVVRNLRLSSGICRTTYAHRLADVDAAATPLVAKCFGEGSIEVHDWAASDCLASAEWAATLWKQCPAARFKASDLLLELLEITREDKGETFIFEPDGGAPLQYVRPPFVIDLLSRGSRFYPLNRWLAARALRRAPEIWKIMRCSQAELEAPRVAGSESWTMRPVSLIHPCARELSRADPRFDIGRHSVFTPLSSGCQAVRTMNIFNRGYYFTESVIERGIRTVLASLVEGGIWVVGRTTEETQPPRNSVSVFQKRGGQFRILTRLNGGSEIERLVLDLD